MFNYKNAEGNYLSGKIIAHIIIGIIILVVVLGSFTIVAPTERGLVIRLGSINRVLVPGVHVKLPILENVVKIAVNTQTITYDSQSKGGDTEAASLFGASKDLQDVSIGVVVNYHQDASKVDSIYQLYGPSYQANVIEPIVRETVKTMSAQYTAEELVTKRAEFSGKVESLLSDKLKEKDAVLEKFNVTNFEFSQSFTQAIEAKVTAVQNAEAAKNKLAQVQYEAQQRVAQAQGEADAIKIQAQAIESQGGAQYVNLQAVNKWNGALPTYMMGNSVPFINLSK